MIEGEEGLIRATIRGFSRSIILWILNKESSSGYRILKELRRLTNQKFYSGTVYPLLYELERGGFIIGDWKSRGRRRIKYYLITDKGREMLNRLRELFKKPVGQVLKSFLGEEK